MKPNQKVFLFLGSAVITSTLALGVMYILLFSVAGRWPIF